MNIPSDTTPAFTRIGLVVVLMITGAAVAMLKFNWPEQNVPTYIVPFLWLFTFLFILRVLGQILVALKPRHWLPPMVQWNLIPYPVLLPIQLVFIVVMCWINFSFAAGAGIAAATNPDFGNFLIAFSAIYALAMPIRYAIRMRRKPDQRWFGGTIPMVFHIVLASYLYTLGCFYVAT